MTRAGLWRILPSTPSGHPCPRPQREEAGVGTRTGASQERVCPVPSPQGLFPVPRRPGLVGGRGPALSAPRTAAGAAQRQSGLWCPGRLPLAPAEVTEKRADSGLAPLPLRQSLGARFRGDRLTPTLYLNLRPLLGRARQKPQEGVSGLAPEAGDTPVGSGGQEGQGRVPRQGAKQEGPRNP